MLEVCAKTLGFESSPDGELVHGVGLGGPGWEAVGVQGEFLLHGGDSAAGFEEEDLLVQVLANSLCK